MIREHLRTVGNYLRTFISHHKPAALEGEFRVFSVIFEEPVLMELLPDYPDGEPLLVKVEDRELKERILSGKVRFGIDTKVRGKVVRVGSFWVLEKGRVT